MVYVVFDAIVNLSLFVDPEYILIPKIGLATLAGQVVDPESAVKFEMRDALKVPGAQN